VTIEKTPEFDGIHRYDAQLNGGKSPSEAMAEVAVQFALHLRANRTWDEGAWYESVLEFAKRVKMGHAEKARLKAELKKLARLISIK
jgi:hypothetical protein